MLLTVSLGSTTAAAEAAVPWVTTVSAVVGSRIVSIEHAPLHRRCTRQPLRPLTARFEYVCSQCASQSIVGACWVVMEDLGCCGREAGSITCLRRSRRCSSSSLDIGCSTSEKRVGAVAPRRDLTKSVLRQWVRPAEAGSNQGLTRLTLV